MKSNWTIIDIYSVLGRYKIDIFENMQILLVEDDHRISQFIIQGLEENGYFVTLSETAEETLNLLPNIRWDLLIVDIMLPGIDGMQLVKKLRSQRIETPILMLSALNSVNDKVNALDIGADDYLTKPFHFSELLSRIKAITRRFQKSKEEDDIQNLKKIGNLLIDEGFSKVLVGEKWIELSPKEYKLLTFLADNVNQAVSRQQILNVVWGITFDNQTNVVDVYISYLRNKLNAHTDKRYIQTVKGVGYCFKTE